MTASRSHLVWVWTKKAAPWALGLLVLGLLARQVHTIDWAEVWLDLRRQPTGGLALAAGLALLSYAVFGSYDLIGRHETRHHVSAPRTVGIAAVCYAFGLNLGALVGAFALKLRLYQRAGLRAATVAHIISLSIATNWLGYLALGGVLLMLAPPPLPPQLQPWVEGLGVRAFGALMFGASAAYVGLCLVRRRRSLCVRGHRFATPGGRVALWQLGVAVANWALMGTIVWVLLQYKLPYPTVLGVLLLAAVAGVVTHVPAGLGVIEAVFVACLGGQLAHTTLLAALLSYRAIYYLVPLGLATLAYALGEASRRSPSALRARQTE